MNHRLLAIATIAALGLTCVKSAVAGTTVRVTYVGPAVVYAPVPVRPVVVTPVVVAAPPPPRRPPVVVYAPPVRVIYAQPVYPAPVVVLR